MAYIILLLFILLAFLVFAEDRIPTEYNRIMFCFFCFALILIAGLREVGLDVDSENYEHAYHNYYNPTVASKMEMSYNIFSSILNKFTNDVHALFLLYASLGVSLKFLAFRKYSASYFLPVLIYISFYFELHEMTQIRTGIISALLLLAIKPMAEQKIFVSLIYIGIASFFHISALIFIPLLLLGNKPIKGFRLYFWASVIPVAYILSSLLSNVSLIVKIPYIGDKLALYQATATLGIFKTFVNTHSPLVLFHIFIFYYLLLFADSITKKNKYFPYMMKVFSLAMAAYIAISFLPVVAERIGYLLRVISILIIPNIIYTIKPRWCGISVVSLIALIFMNYGLKYIDFILLWKVSD